MHPDAEPPTRIADEVGVGVGDPEVVDGDRFASIPDLFERDPFPGVGRELVAGFELGGGDPAVPFDPERVFPRGLDRPAPDRQFVDLRLSGIDLLDLTEFDRGINVVLRSGEDDIAGFQMFDGDGTQRSQNRRPGREAGLIQLEGSSGAA